MAKPPPENQQKKTTTTLGRETIFKGTLRFSESLRIEGKFEGKIISTGYLYVAEGAVITADIKVDSVVIGGIINGNIEARDKVEMLSTGQVYGNVKTAKLRIDDGVIFEGKCEMIKNPENIDIFATSIGNLKKSMQRVSS